MQGCGVREKIRNVKVPVLLVLFQVVVCVSAMACQEYRVRDQYTPQDIHESNQLSVILMSCSHQSTLQMMVMW